MIKEFENLKEVQMIVFQLGKEEYAVPITCVQEIIMLQTPTRIPKAPSFIEGVINLRGRIIPVLDGRTKFQIEADKANLHDARIMVLDVEQEIIGLIVDAVSEVVHLKTEDIEPSPVDIGEESDFLWGVGKFQDRLLILINPEKFLTHTEARDLKHIAKVTEAIQQAKESMKDQKEEKEVAKQVTKADSVKTEPLKNQEIQDLTEKELPEKVK